MTLQSVVISPESHVDSFTKQPSRVVGRRANVTIPLYDTPDRKLPDGTPGTIEGWVQIALNELKKFLGNALPEGENAGVVIETCLKALQEAKPYHNFSTRGYTPKPTTQNPKPDRMVFTQFDGVCEAPGSNGQQQVQDNTAEASTTTTTEETPAGGSFDEFGDIDSLVKRAEEKDKEAQERLIELAVAAGNERAVVEALDTWQAVADLAIGAGDEAPAEEAPAEEAAPEEPWKPKKEEVYKLKPETEVVKTDPKTKKKMRVKQKATKAVEVEITAVDEKTSTVTCLNNSDRKTTYKNVKWDDLIVE
jgi:hypothetical protein